MSHEPPPLTRTARSKFGNKSQNDRWHPWHGKGGRTDIRLTTVGTRASLGTRWQISLVGTSVPLESGFFLSLVKGRRATWHFSCPNATSKKHIYYYEPPAAVSNQAKAMKSQALHAVCDHVISNWLVTLGSERVKNGRDLKWFATRKGKLVFRVTALRRCDNDEHTN